MSLQERFEASYSPEPMSGCWLWTGLVNEKGYGRIGLGKHKMLKAHRVSWMLAHGEMPDLSVLHRCDNPCCVNPDHLFLGTQADNMRDRDVKHRGNQPKGEKVATAKLTEDAVRAIRSSSFRVARKIAEAYGVSMSSVYDIRKKRTWKHVQ